MMFGICHQLPFVIILTSHHSQLVNWSFGHLRPHFYGIANIDPCTELEISTGRVDASLKQLQIRLEEFLADCITGQHIVNYRAALGKKNEWRSRCPDVLLWFLQN